MNIHKEIKSLGKIEKPIVTFSAKYCKSIDFRTTIKSLPVVGGYLDNLLAYKGSKIIQERVDLFFEETAKALESLDKEKININFFEGEEGFYMFQKVYEQVIRAKEKEKAKYFRNIFICVSCTVLKIPHQSVPESRFKVSPGQIEA